MPPRKRKENNDNDGGNDADENKVSKGKQSRSSRSSKSKSNSSSSNNYEVMDSVGMVLPGTKKLFLAQKKGLRGSKVTKAKHGNRRSILPSQQEMLEHNKTRQTCDPLQSVHAAHWESYVAQFHDWLWLTQVGFNLLLYGMGSKLKLMETFATDCLDKEDVLSISGNSTLSGDRVIKSLLTTISTKILNFQQIPEYFDSMTAYAHFLADALNTHYGREQKIKYNNHSCASSSSSSSSSVAVTTAALSLTQASDNISLNGSLAAEEQETVSNSNISSSNLVRRSSRPLLARRENIVEDGNHAEWGKRYAHAQAKLYILVEAIDGSALQSEMSVQVLSCLARCASITIIATADTLNVGFLWTTAQLASFRWNYLHTPTFEPLPFVTDLSNKRKESTGGGGGSGSMNNNGNGMDEFGLHHILTSLSSRHLECLQLYASMTMSQTQSSFSTLMDHGFLLDNFLAQCCKKMIVRSLFELRALLGELADHKLLKVTLNDKKQERVAIVPATVTAMTLSLLLEKISTFKQ